MKNSVLSEFAVNESLRAITEGVGEGIATGVNDLHLKVLLDQSEGDLGPAALNGAFLDIAAYLETSRCARSPIAFSSLISL